MQNIAAVQESLTVGSNQLLCPLYARGHN